ncbi:hypothetical protein OG308_24340 [Nocardia salmonicida]|uniref:Uncharacterized protein n=1 Tax=Nocardia salmonicida TaxID=53431 RepID=A0ABZ1N393_9NOCA
MIIRITEHAATVHETDDLTRMHVECHSDASAADSALRRAGLGYVIGAENAVLDAAAVRSHCADPTPDWEQRWTAMITYATAKGWTRDEGRSIVAHIEKP